MTRCDRPLLVCAALAAAMLTGCPPPDDGGGGNGGDHQCGPKGCPVDAAPGPVCGDHTCETGETAQTCPADCTTCGNNVCDAGETAQSCPADCKCGNHVC